MKVALFTSQFPGKLNTFFARDVAALLKNGIKVDVFPIYPEDPSLWRYVPGYLNEVVLPRERVKQVEMGPRKVARSALALMVSPGWIRDTAKVITSAARFGTDPILKSLYAILKAKGFSERHAEKYDVVLSYFGNYAATAAYFFQKHCAPNAAFGFYLHAGVDLYRDQVFLLEKMLHADRIFVVCEFNRGKIQELYPDDFARLDGRVQLHHLGLNLSDLQYIRAGRSTDVVLGVGRHDKNKGFDYVLRAAACAIGRGSCLKLRLIGEGPETAGLKALAVELGIVDRVTFAGLLPFEAVADEMRQAAVLAHGSPEIGDAVPTVIKEAMAVGLPVVATKVAGIPELLDQGRCGVLTEPRDFHAMGSAIQRLLENPAESEALAVKARAFAERMFDQAVNGKLLADSIKLMKAQGGLNSLAA